MKVQTRRALCPRENAVLVYLGMLATCSLCSARPRNVAIGRRAAEAIFLRSWCRSGLLYTELVGRPAVRSIRTLKYIIVQITKDNLIRRVTTLRSCRGSGGTLVDRS
jgi:hypothetical protein